MNRQNSVFEMLRLGVTLALYAAAACTILAAVNMVTSVRIAQNKTDRANAAMKAVFPEADSFVPAESFSPAQNASAVIQSVYLAKQNGMTAGGVAEVSGPTYDRGTLMVGMKTDGTITGVQFLELTDSPGFGLKANDPTFHLASGKTFCGQFEGKNARDGFLSGAHFDSISGATITSVAAGNLITEGTGCLFELFSRERSPE
ncbi:MAG: FMN-binding protein [Treponema sp.]|nr:FMN-binding protein [Treponema sp.]